MITMPIQDVIQKIVEKTGKPEQEVSSEIQKKMDQLSGFVSKDGAAYIIAHQYGVKLFQADGGKLKIKNVRRIGPLRLVLSRAPFLY